MFTGYVAGLEPGQWVALTVDGTVAGLGPVFVGRSDKLIVEIMIDPALMHAGENELDLYLVGSDGTTLSPVSMS